jgi:hypothetical protein
MEWQLPKVVFDWTARCVSPFAGVLPIQTADRSRCVRFVVHRSPPPPPGVLKHGPLAELALQDPEGFSIAEQALNDFFPPLNQIVSVATGSRINNKYGPKYAVSTWETSVAFLATVRRQLSPTQPPISITYPSHFRVYRRPLKIKRASLPG